MIPIKDFNLRYTIESGQPLTFYSSYSKSGSEEALKYVTMTGAIEVKISGNSMSRTFSGDYSNRSADAEVKERFGLSDDMQDVYKKISTDQFLSDAIKDFYGMRITRNDPWEATLCFVISQFNNLKE